MIPAADKEKAQYTFDVMASHLLTQGKKSMSVEASNIKIPQCAYRGDDNTRCAVGFCIKDEKYTPAIEKLNAGNTLVLASIDDRYYKDVHFLQRMQMAHDIFPPDSWANRLCTIADDFGLDSSIVDTFTSITIPQPQALVYEAV